MVGPLPQRTALILVDVQQGFKDPAWGARNNPDAERQMARLLRSWRGDGRPIFFIRHDSTEPQSPLRPDQPGNAIQDIVKPEAGEPVIGKQVNSAFIGTDLEDQLRAAGVRDVVICGLTTNHCVSTTARMAANLGFRTIVAEDATAAFEQVDHNGQHHPAQQVHDMALANLHKEFATIARTDAILTAGHVL